MSQSVYDARAAEAWRLVHEKRMTMKTVSKALKVPMSKAYEMLATRKSRIEQIQHRKAAFGSIAAIQRTPNGTSDA